MQMGKDYSISNQYGNIFYRKLAKSFFLNRPAYMTPDSLSLDPTTDEVNTVHDELSDSEIPQRCSY